MSNNPDDNFLTSYYTSFIRTKPKSSSTSIFLPSSSITIQREQHSPSTFTSDHIQAIRNFHNGRIVRILIVTYTTSFINNATCYLIIGQIKFDDGSMERFVENLHVNEEKLVINSNVIMLDEEIVYSKSEFLNKFVINEKMAVLVKDGAKFTYKAVIDNFGKYGKIVAFEKKNGDGLLEYETNDAVNNLKGMCNVLKDKGIHLVFDCGKGKI